MSIRLDKSDRTTFMEKHDIGGKTIENDPLLSNSKPFADFITKYQKHFVKGFDRIDLISFKYYNTPSYWWLIMLANKMIDERELVEGSEIIIPTLVDYQTYLDAFTQ